MGVGIRTESLVITAQMLRLIAEIDKFKGESIGIVFETATPFDTPRLMEPLIAWVQATDGDGE